MIERFVVVFLFSVIPFSVGPCCYQPNCQGCNPPGSFCDLSQSNCENACHGTWCGPSPPPSPPSPAPPSPPPPGSCVNPPPCVSGITFPSPTVTVNRSTLTTEQQLWQDTWPGYLNGVSFGGLYVIEDWMFWRTTAPYNDSTLHLTTNEGYYENSWSQNLLTYGPDSAFRTIDCHLNHYLEDDDLDKLADFGINAVRLPVGYWIFDDVHLYPNDTWPIPPSTSSNGYGVNPEGFITSGTLPLSNLIVRLYNRNIKVLLDIHAQSGCSSPRNSYAGILCQDQAPNTWNGKAQDGISGGHSTTRARDGKTWMEVAHKILVQRVVPWVNFINTIAPGTVIAIEPVNEPDIGSSDATTDEVRCLTLYAGQTMLSCLSNTTSAKDVDVVMSNAAHNYPTTQIAQDYRTSQWSPLKNRLITDIHHYYNWGGCYSGGNDIGLSCVCHTGQDGFDNQDGDWKGYQDSGVFNDGWRFIVGEWSSALGVAHNCNPNRGPDPTQAAAMYVSQKYSYLGNYVRYMGKSTQAPSSFLGDFYWTARMGYNWNPDPDVCYGPTSMSDYKDYQFWDWSLIRLIGLELIPKLSQLKWTPSTLSNYASQACSGSFKINC